MSNKNILNVNNNNNNNNNSNNDDNIKSFASSLKIVDDYNDNSYYYDDDDEDDESDNNSNEDHYREEFFQSVSQKQMEIPTTIQTNNYNNSDNIVLVNTKNSLTPISNKKSKNNKNNTNRNNNNNRKKVINNIEYDRRHIQYTLDRLKDNSNACGNELSKLFSGVNLICNNISKISNDNMENYASTIDNATFETIKSAESMKCLINTMELLNSDLFEVTIKLNNDIKNVKKGVDQLESLIKSLK